MKQSILLACLVVLSFAFSGYAANASVDFSGEWLLDDQKSDPMPIPIRDLGAPGPGGGGGMMGGGGGMMGGGGGMMGGGGGFPGGGFPGGGFPGAKPPADNKPVPMVIRQSGTDIQITTTVNGQPIIETYSYNGKEVVESVPPAPNSQDPGKKKTKATLKKNSLSIQQNTQYSQTENGFKKDYSLSSDGKTLTVKIKTTNRFGMMVNQTQQKLVYNKQ